MTECCIYWMSSLSFIWFILAGFYMSSRRCMCIKHGQAYLIWESSGLEGIEWGRQHSLHGFHVRQLVFCLKTLKTWGRKQPPKLLGLFLILLRKIPFLLCLLSLREDSLVLVPGPGFIFNVLSNEVALYFLSFE